MAAPSSFKNTMSSGAIASSANIRGATVLDKSGVLCGALFVHNGSDDPVVTIYDDAGTATTGTVLFYYTCNASASVADGSGKLMDYYKLPDIIFKLGCYVAIANCTVYLQYR